MNTLSNTNEADQIYARIGKLQATSEPLWGKMNVNQMICHITDPFRDLLNIRTTKNATPVMLRPIVRMMVLGKMPHGKNMPTSKPYLQSAKGQGTKPKVFETDLADLKELYKQYVALDPKVTLGCHGALGKMNRAQADKYLWKHIDHHLRQFAV